MPRADYPTGAVRGLIYKEEMKMDISKALRLYVIPDREIGAPKSLIRQTRELLAGGATAIQLRDKGLNGRDLLKAAKEMAALCKASGAMFIVNDRLDIAILSGAHGLHIGQTDLPLLAAKELSPTGFIIGVSAQTIEEAKLAEKQGAAYLGIGAVVPTSTKEADALGMEGVAKVAAAARLPSVAIGGISLGNAAEVMQTGVSGISLISAIVGKPDITEETKKFLEIVNG